MKYVLMKKCCHNTHFYIFVDVFKGFTRSYDIKYFYMIQVICTQSYSFKYSNLISIIIKFQVIISIHNSHSFVHNHLLSSNN